jgi:hypothetical protein
MPEQPKLKLLVSQSCQHLFPLQYLFAITISHILCLNILEVPENHYEVPRFQVTQEQEAIYNACLRIIMINATEDALVLDEPCTRTELPKCPQGGGVVGFKV